MIELAEVESRLALFAEGIAGRYYHIKPSSEYSSRRLIVDAASAAMTSDTLLLPDALDAEAPAYRVLALEQLAVAQFGSLDFTIAEARRRIPDLRRLAEPDLGVRVSDFELFYQHVEHPAVLSRLFAMCERGRLKAHIRHHYPGIKRHQDAYHERLLADMAAADLNSVPGVVQCLNFLLLGADLPELEKHPLGGALRDAFTSSATVGASVYDTAAASLACYALCEPFIVVHDAELALPDELELDEPAHWLQREARLEDWQEDLKEIDGMIMSVEMLDADNVAAADTDNLADGELRPDDLDLRALENERDTMKRRMDMERSAIRDATGKPRPEARSYRYDEWDYLGHRYLAKWCRLFEERLEPEDGADLNSLKQVIINHRAGVQQQLENIKPLGFQRVFRVADGDELDFNAVIQARQDIRAGISPDERVYSRRERVHRDVCASFLVDLSASTDDPIDEPEPDPTPTAADDGTVPNLRDPYDDDPYAIDHNLADAKRRRIIDVQREAMLVMSAALEQLGDSYGIYGFSGYGRDCVEFFVAKEPEQAFTQATLASIASMKPKRSTRMGPAIRHAVGKLLRSGNALKVLMILSDGFPQDSDYGPERGEHEYGLQDTAKALAEAHDKGVETFCVTVDRSGHDYLKRMCPDARYMVIEEIEDLPEALTKVYEALTA
ncbi:MAG: hypothetical protein OES38_10735 [Gammaproteobacteria bacterium]|nr:hypothetical protein [Gammaproteobacteria bacterium]